MAKPTRIASKQSVQKRAESAYDILTNEAVHWDTLRSRVRSKLSGLLLPADDLIRGHGTESLYFLAALWNVSKQISPFDSFSDALIRSFDPERDPEMLRNMFPDHVLAQAYAISINADQALIIINQNLGELLTGTLARQTRHRYFTQPISTALPTFWSDIYNVVSNITWNSYSQQLLSDNESILTGSSLRRYLSKALAQYFATNGLRSCLKVDCLNALDGVNLYVALTDNSQHVAVVRVELFEGNIVESRDASSSISNQAREVSEHEDWEINELLVLPETSEFDGHEIPRVVTKQNKQSFPLPIKMQFVDTSEKSQSLFCDVDDVNLIGFGISFREEVLGLRELSDREQLELSAAIHEIAIPANPNESIDEPIPVPPPMKGKRKKALTPEQERQHLVDRVVDCKLMSRRNAERASLSSLRSRLADYEDNLAEEDEDDE